MPDYTTVNVRPDTWKELNARKEPGDSFDDVIRRELGLDVPEDAVDHDIEDAVRDRLEGAKFQVDDDPARELREEELKAVVAAVEYLAEKNTSCSPGELKETVHPDHDTGKSADYWWKWVREAFRELDGELIDYESQRSIRYSGDGAGTVS